MTDGSPVIAYVAFGANLGDRESNIRAALDALGATPGVRVTRVSSLIENPAVGGPADSPAFLNGMAEVETTLDPHSLLNRLLEIERSLGRERRMKWAPRSIDLDLVLYGNRVIDTADLKVPHPLMHERRFVLEPLVQIAPEITHPSLHTTAAKLLERTFAVGDDERGSLIREIDQAFDGIERGDGITLHEAEAIDCHATSAERAAERERNTETRWQDVPRSDLEAFSSIWGFFDERGLVYYLPAGMTWSLIHGSRSDSATPDSILSVLSRPDRQRWCESLMTRAQLRATLRFVAFMLDHYWISSDDSLESKCLREWIRELTV